MSDDYYRDRARQAYHQLRDTMARSDAGHPLDAVAVLDAHHLVQEITGERGETAPARCLAILAIHGDIPSDDG